jgi:hypothetical protein
MKWTDAEREKRFMAKVEMEPMSGCWIWTGCVLPHGNYQQPWVSFRGKQQPAARASWKLFKGEIPQKTMVLHDCHNCYCVNPAHLHLGDNVMNMKEMAHAGRQNGGFGAIGNELVKEAIELRKQGSKVVDLAKRYGIHHKSMSRILNGGRYRHLAKGENNHV